MVANDKFLLFSTCSENQSLNHTILQEIVRTRNCSPNFSISKVVRNVFDIDENNSHDEDNTPVSNVLYYIHHQTFEVTSSSSIK